MNKEFERIQKEWKEYERKGSSKRKKSLSDYDVKWLLQEVSRLDTVIKKRLESTKEAVQKERQANQKLVQLVGDMRDFGDSNIQAAVKIVLENISKSFDGEGKFGKTFDIKGIHNKG